MKNDLDFIRDKIENSGVKAPEDMNETYVADTLENVYPKLTAVGQQPKRRRRTAAIAVSATAAGLVLVITLGIVLNSFFGNGVRSLSLPGGLKLKQFHSYAQVQQEVNRLRSKNERMTIFDYISGSYKDAGNYVEDYDGRLNAGYDAAEESKSGFASDSATGSSGSASGSSGHSETYRQVAGVDEADIIKTDGKYIYCVDSNYANGNKIVIFTAEGKNARRAAEISIEEDLKNATVDEADPWSYRSKQQDIKDIYLKDDRLIVVCNDTVGHYDYTVGTSRVIVYDVSDVDHISMLDTVMQSGYYDSSRMIGDTLYTVSSYSPYNDKIIPVCGRGATPEEVPADCIYTLADNDSESFLVVSAYDTLDYSAQTESKSVLGGVDDIYCNENHMYIYTSVWEDSRYLARNHSEVFSQILKVDLTDGIAFTAYTKVPGTIDDQYALDEYNGNLRVATTSATGWIDTNNLYVLDENLNVIGSVTGFAKNESIKAVRYLGDTAYVITYEQTDPLFVIDLSDPTAPEILGEVKISGFSTMLVPVDKNTVLGIGYHTQDESYTDMEVQEGLKLALFDVSDKANPKVLDSMAYADCYSVVQYNPKALVFNPERGDFIIPLNYSHWGGFVDGVYEYYNEGVYYGGVLNFKVQDGKLVEIGRYKADYDEVERCVYVGDNVYMTYYDSYGTLQLDSVPYK